jgi:hypothetical protein
VEFRKRLDHKYVQIIINGNALKYKDIKHKTIKELG